MNAEEVLREMREVAGRKRIEDDYAYLTPPTLFAWAAAIEAELPSEATLRFLEAAMDLGRMRFEGVEFSVFAHGERTALFDAAYRRLIAQREGG